MWKFAIFSLHRWRFTYYFNHSHHSYKVYECGHLFCGKSAEHWDLSHLYAANGHCSRRHFGQRHWHRRPLFGVSRNNGRYTLSILHSGRLILARRHWRYYSTRNSSPKVARFDGRGPAFWQACRKYFSSQENVFHLYWYLLCQFVDCPLYMQSYTSFNSIFINKKYLLLFHYIDYWFDNYMALAIFLFPTEFF